MSRNVLFGRISCGARGVALERMTANLLSRLGMHVEAADEGECVNGSKLGKHQTAEGKSCQMQWKRSSFSNWILEFVAVKRHLHERLFLTWMTPERIHILEYSGDKGMVAEGETMPPNGKAIYFGAPGGEKGLVDWREAEAFLLKQLVHHDGCRYIACIRHTQAHSERFTRLGGDAFRRSHVD